MKYISHVTDFREGKTVVLGKAQGPALLIALMAQWLNNTRGLKPKQNNILDH